MYRSIPKPPIPPPRQTPEHLTFLKNFGQIPRYVASLDGQMPHPLELQRGSNPPTSRENRIAYLWKYTESLPFGNKFCKIFSHYEFLVQLVFAPRSKQRHIPRYDYIKRQQQKKPTWNRQEERGSLAEAKNCEILLFPTADRRFDRKVKCPTGRASFWVKFPTVRSLTRVKCPEVARGAGGRWAVLELTGT